MNNKPSLVMQVYNPITWEARAGEFRVQASLGYLYQNLVSKKKTK
jgi:hypothetical protein